MDDLRTRLRLRKDEVAAYGLHWRLARARNLRVLIFAQGRTGSTLLESLICSSGHFKKNGEVLGKSGTRVWFPVEYIQGLSQRNPTQPFICHVKLYHLTRDREAIGLRAVRPRTFVRKLSDAGWRLIYLHRQDRIRHAVSNLVAEARGGYHKFDDRKESVLVHIDRARFEALVAERVKFEAQEREALEDVVFHEVVYERDLQDPSRHQQTLDDIFDYLGLESRPVTTRLRKISARPLREIILNYDEFSRWVTALGYEASL